MTDERRLAGLREFMEIDHGVTAPDVAVLLRLLDDARAETARILAMLHDPPEDVVETVAKGMCARWCTDHMDDPQCQTARRCGYKWRGDIDDARAAISALAGKVAEGR